MRKKNLTQDCNKRHYIERPITWTFFHNVKFGLRKAFGSVFEMNTSRKALSVNQISKRYERHATKDRLFMQKVREAMKSSGNHPMKGNVIVDEFIFGGRENQMISLL